MRGRPILLEPYVLSYVSSNKIDRMFWRKFKYTRPFSLAKKIWFYNFVPRYSTPNTCRINRLEVSFPNPARVIPGIIVILMFVYTPPVTKRCFITEKHIFQKKKTIMSVHEKNNLFAQNRYVIWENWLHTSRECHPNVS
jgi:hypothetical protein